MGDCWCRMRLKHLFFSSWGRSSLSCSEETLLWSHCRTSRHSKNWSSVVAHEGSLLYGFKRRFFWDVPNIPTSNRHISFTKTNNSDLQPTVLTLVNILAAELYERIISKLPRCVSNCLYLNPTLSIGALLDPDQVESMKIHVKNALRVCEQLKEEGKQTRLRSRLGTVLTLELMYCLQLALSLIWWVPSPHLIKKILEVSWPVYVYCEMEDYRDGMADYEAEDDAHPQPPALPNALLSAPALLRN